MTVVVSIHACLDNNATLAKRQIHQRFFRVFCFWTRIIECLPKERSSKYSQLEKAWYARFQGAAEKKINY